jgi:hypothetical protein
LDASDTARFPEAQFGTASKTNATRFTKIANAMAPYGALQNDPQAAGDTSWNALNDVGWQIYTGNFQMWLTQINPNGTSQGLWRQGPKTQMYGRFARRFDHASGKDAMYFDIDDRFFGGQALNAGYPVTFRVVYLDQGTGSFALKYDAVNDPEKTAFTVTKTNSGQWKEKTVTVSDGYLFNRISVPSSVATGATADLMLVNTDAEDDTFHMIEVTRDFGATPPPDDTTPPTVVSTVPAANATRVAATTNVTATFSEDMLASSINGTTFKLFKKGSTTKIGASVVYPDPDPNSPPYTAKLDPTNSLRSGVTYKAVVTTGAKDLAGKPLAQQYSWFFTVR